MFPVPICRCKASLPLSLALRFRKATPPATILCFYGGFSSAVFCASKTYPQNVHLLHITQIPTGGCISASCFVSICLTVLSAGTSRAAQRVLLGLLLIPRLRFVQKVFIIGPEKLSFDALFHHIRLCFCIKVCKCKP